MMSNRLRKGSVIFVSLLVLSLLMPVSIVSYACVGRTIYIGYYEKEMEQSIMSTLLSIFIDERTGTSVKLVSLDSREQGFDYLKRDKVSILVEYPGRVIDYYRGTGNIKKEDGDFSSLRSTLSGKLNAIFVVSPGYDSTVSPGEKHGNMGKAYIILSRRSLSRFPALPRLLKKLSGKIENDTMALFITHSRNSTPDKVTRNYLKKSKLI